jgi:predicted O-methyltransferase YrrM
MNENILNQLKNLITKTTSGVGDSDKHLMPLFSIALASGAKNILELGVRNGDTSLPLLMATNLTGGTLHSVDINKTSFLPPVELKNNWKFYQSDAIEFLNNWDRNINVDLVYVDDWHSYEHVKKELELLDTIVSPQTVIILHDLMYGNTCPFYHSDLTTSAGSQWENGGPYRAVAELNPQFWEFSTLPWNNGLTILRKKYSNKYKQK